MSFGYGQAIMRLAGETAAISSGVRLPCSQAPGLAAATRDSPAQAAAESAVASAGVWPQAAAVAPS